MAHSVELTTFGAVLTFATELEGRAVRFYQEAADSPACTPAREVLLGLADGSQRRQELLVTTRRENVTEMVLEPITGLRAEDYEPSVQSASGLTLQQALAAAMEMERRSARFYTEVGERARHLLAGVARTFTRLARENERRLKQLEALPAP